MNLEKEIFDLSLADIMPNRFQPREIFDDEALTELAESIKQHGVIQPIIVRKIGDKYEIIAGERRYRASKLAGVKTIPALIRNIDDKEAAKVALLENLQRRDLSPIEEAKTYQTILKLDNLTQEELAKNLGKSQSAVANKLRLLNLDEDVQTALLNNEISERHARSLLQLEQEDQKNLLNRTINERLTVKQLDDEVAKILNGDTSNSNENEVAEEPKLQTINLEQKQEKESEVPKSNIFDKLRVDNQKKEEDEVLTSKIDSDFSKINELIKDNDEQSNEDSSEEETELDKEFSKINELIEDTIEKSGVKEQEENKNTEQEAQKTEAEPPKYDLRFAINNFRQAIQNTEKFGFKVKTEEFENSENYQLIITINKNNDKS